MENTNRKYSACEILLFTLVINHAHMEQQIRIAATEVMVIRRL